MNPEQWKLKKDEFESRSLRSVNATSSDVKVHIRNGKKGLASSAQTLSEADSKPHAKAVAHATTLHIQQKNGGRNHEQES